MSYTNGLDNPELYFQCKLYTGTGSSASITLDGDTDMQPDLVWIKSRNDTNPHTVVDSVRGATKIIWTNVNSVEGTHTDEVTSFDSDGFSLGASSNAYANENTITHVAWCWKANGSGSSNTDGSITSTVSANTTAEFSIVSYTGTNNNKTVGHGLGVAPKVIILKNRSTANNWCVGHGSLGFDKHLALNDTDAVGTDSTYRFQGTAPTSTVFSVGAAGETNGSGNNIIAYCFAEKQGFSKFGSYTGNGNADGPFVPLSFRPAWVLVKKSSGADNWTLADNKRPGYNSSQDTLYPNLSNAEVTTTNWVDFYSNGFKLLRTDGAENGSGATYIYMAFAEAPFVNSNGVPCNAR